MMLRTACLTHDLYAISAMNIHLHIHSYTPHLIQNTIAIWNLGLRFIRLLLCSLGQELFTGESSEASAFKQISMFMLFFYPFLLLWLNINRKCTKHYQKPNGTGIKVPHARWEVQWTRWLMTGLPDWGRLKYSVANKILAHSKLRYKNHDIMVSRMS